VVAHYLTLERRRGARRHALRRGRRAGGAGGGGSLAKVNPAPIDGGGISGCCRPQRAHLLRLAHLHVLHLILRKRSFRLFSGRQVPILRGCDGVL